jgi:hypothetical protein
MQKFHLSVIQPIKGKPGRVMFTYERTARNVSEAVEAVRSEIAGSGWAVVQTSSLSKAKAS